MATGAYSYTAVVSSYWSDGTSKTASLPVRVLIVNERNSPLGLGWSIPGVQRVHVQAGGAVVVTGGDGSAGHFARTSCGTDPYTGIYSCSYIQPAGDFSTLTYFDAGGVGSYIRAYPNGTRIFFDAGGLQTSIEDRHGNTTRFGYTSGRLTSITDPAGKVTTLGYHTYGGLAWIRDPAGRQANATASMGILYQFTDPDGESGLNMNFEGDRLEGFWPRGQSTAGGAATRWQFTYDHARRLASRTAPTVNVNAQPSRPVIRYASLETAVLAPVGRGSSTYPAPAVGSSSVRIQATDPRNNTTRLALDRFGAPTLIEEPLGRTTRLTRNTLSQVTVSVSPSNQRVEYLWSGPNLIRSADLSVSLVDTMVYVNNRLRERSIRALNGNVYWPAVAYHYRGVYLDSVTVYSGVFATMQELPVLQPGGGSRAATYQMDSMGRLTALTDGAGYTTRYYYAAAGWMNVDSVVAPGRRKTTYTYDAYGRARSVRDALGHADTLDYDPMNRIRRVAQPGGLVTRFEYGAVHLATVTDARNQVYRFTTNALGWTETETDPLGRQEHYRFDANGNVTRWTNRRGQHIELAYDALNQRSSRTADGVVTQYHSDPQGRLRTTHVPGVSTDTLRFDERGRPTQQVAVHGGRRHVLTSSYGNSFTDARTSVHLSAPWTRTVSFTNFLTGQLHQLRDPADRKTTVDYDSRRLATAYTLPTGNTMSLRYPSTSQAAHVSHSHAGLNTAFGVHYQQGMLAQTVSRSNAGGDSLREMTYDAHGQLRGISDYRVSTSTTTCEWRWDPDTGEHCESETTRTLLGQVTYTFDPVGNRTDRGAVVGTGNRLTSVDGYTLTYDADGNLTRKYWTTNAAAFDQRLTWNSLGQLTSATTNGAAVTYRYNGWGELVSRSDAGGTIRYVYDGDDLFMETVDGWAEPYRVYTNYPGIDHPHSVQVWTPTTASQVYYFATEYPGNVLGLFDASNQVVNRYRYDPWGRSELASEQVSNAIRYAGRYRDWGTGLDYNRHRWYDAHTGRFVSQDPLGIAGGINPYVYTGNSPVDYTDPHGLIRVPKWVVPIAAFAITVVAGVSNGMSWSEAGSGAAQAFGATAIGAGLAAGVEAAVSETPFSDAFHRNLNISTAFLAGGAVIAAILGGETEMGANGFFQGYVRSSKTILKDGALTLGSAAVFSKDGPNTIYKKVGALGRHERGHTVQFILLSQFGNPWVPYLALGAIGAMNGPGIGRYTQWWEDMATFVGR